MRADIQGLRALAVLLVVAAHITGVPAGGFIGVDVFFCISGFLITGLIIREKDRSGRVSLRDFYLRRARRILPVALIVLVATNVAARLIFVGARVHQTFVDSVWALFFTANVHFARLGTSYFDAERPRSALLHFWSLAVEEQFYVVWPCLLILALVVARRRGARPPVVVGVVAAIVIVGSFAFALQQTDATPVSSYFAATTRAWELGIGALTAALVASARRVPARVGAVATWIAFATIVASAFVIDEATPFPGLATLVPVLATAVILGVGEVPSGVGAPWALGFRPWQYIGGISYSLYLWHWPALVFADAYYGKGTTTARVVAAVAGFGLAALTYALIEQPIRTTRRIRPLVLAPTGLAVLGTVVLMADTAPSIAPTQRINVAATATTLTTTTTTSPPTGAIAATPTTVRRTPPTTVRDETALLRQLVKASTEATEWGPLDPPLEDLPNAGAPEWIVDECLDIDASNMARCVYGNPNGNRLATILGDSVAVSYLPAIRNVLGSEWRIQVLTLDLCPMVDTPTRQFIGSKEPDTRCTDHQRWVHEQLDAARPDLVILASAINSANRMVDGGERSSASNAQRWGEAFGRELSVLVPKAARTVVIGSPTGTRNLQECVTRSSSPRDCAIDLYPFWGMVRDAERGASNAHGATYVDPLDWLCYANVCPAVIGSTPVNWDGAHLTAAYSRRLAPVLAPFLRG